MEIKLVNILGASFEDKFLYTKSDATKKAYIKYINDFFQSECLEDVTLSQLNSVTLSMAQLYQDSLLKKGFQPSSVNQQTTALSHFFDFLIENNVVKFNPFSKSQGLINIKKAKEDTLDSLIYQKISEWPEILINKIQELKQLIDEEKELRIGFWNLLTYFPKWKDKSKKKYVLFLDLLEKFNIGLEPDLRFTGVIPRMNGNVILFSLDNYENTATYSPAFAFASLNIRLGAIVSQSDGIVVEKEIMLLKDQIEHWPGLNNLEKKRLELYMDWLLSRPINNKKINQRLQELSIEEKSLIGDWLLKVSLADGIVQTEEINLMQKLYSRMNLDPKELQKYINADISGPVTKKTNKYIDRDNPTAVELLDFLLDYIG